MDTRAKVQLSTATLRKILERQEAALKQDNSLSDIIEISTVRKTDRHAGEDIIVAWAISGYSECQGSHLYNSPLH